MGRTESETDRFLNYLQRRQFALAFVVLNKPIDTIELYYSLRRLASCSWPQLMSGYSLTFGWLSVAFWSSRLSTMDVIFLAIFFIAPLHPMIVRPTTLRMSSKSVKCLNGIEKSWVLMVLESLAWYATIPSLQQHLQHIWLKPWDD